MSEAVESKGRKAKLRFDQARCDCGQVWQMTYLDYREYLRIKAGRPTFTRGLIFHCPDCGHAYGFDFMELTGSQVAQLDRK